jgi:methionyl-tRNA synthetase
LNGQRMSKTLGTIVDPIDAADRLGADPLRLYLVKEIAFGGDGDFSWDRYDERYNVDLANNLGNLVSRVAAMAGRYRNGVLRPSGGGSDQLVRLGEQIALDYRRAMDAFAIHEGAAAAYRMIDATNEFIAATAPWALAKDAASADRLTQVLFDAAEAIRFAAVLLAPIMPSSSREILRRVGASGDRLHLDHDGRWRTEGERVLLQEGPLWPRREAGADARVRPYETEETVPAGRSPVVGDKRAGPTSPGVGTDPPVGPTPSKEIQPVPENPTPPPALPSTDTPAAAGSAPAPQETARISIDDFMKMELRTAKVLAAERVPKSNKLLKLQVDAGTEHRTLVAGIAEAYEPEALVGKTVVIVFNLKPAKLMGVESNGMVLAASPDGGKPIVVSFDEAPPPGTRVR